MKIGRSILLRCGDMKSEKHKCRHSRHEKDVCCDCHCEEVKKWYHYGYIVAKSSKPDYFKKLEKRRPDKHEQKLQVH